MAGTVYSLAGTPTAASPVTENTVHSFYGIRAMPTDGKDPDTGLTQGAGNVLYGAAAEGGGHGNAGVVFSLLPNRTGPGSYAVLHRFGGPGDGINPTLARLTLDGQGRLYGTTNLGGANGVGTVYNLQHVGGAWQEQVLYSFPTAAADPTNVQSSETNVVLDKAGNVYGCGQGGAYGEGGVFELTPPAQKGATWTEQIIFTLNGATGELPVNSFGCNFTIDPATGQLFGTVPRGGAYGYGAIIELNPPAAGHTAWTETIIHSFTGQTDDGSDPVAPPLKVGNTYYGGAGYSIYQFTP